MVCHLELTLIPAQFGDFSDKSIKGYPYNLKKANELLDKAGYKKRKGEKYRRQPNGKKLTINVAVRNTQPNAEKIWTNYIQQWQKIGLDAKFVGGRQWNSTLGYKMFKQIVLRLMSLKVAGVYHLNHHQWTFTVKALHTTWLVLFLQLNLNFLLTLIQLRPSTTSTVYKHLISGNNGCMTMPMLYLPQTVGQ